MDEQAAEQSVTDGWIIWDISNLGRNVAFGFDHIPQQVSKILRNDGWRRFVVPYEQNVVEYRADEFEKFVSGTPPRGLGISIHVLERICGSVDTTESREALILLKKIQRNGE